MQKACCVCERMLHDGDEITAVVSSVYHTIPSNISYAIEQPTACYQMAHADCMPGAGMEL